MGKNQNVGTKSVFTLENNICFLMWERNNILMWDRNKNLFFEFSFKLQCWEEVKVLSIPPLILHFVIKIAI